MSNKIRKAFIQKLQASRVANVLAMIAQERIRERGSDIGGYAPLWADTAQIRVQRSKRGKSVAVTIPHYRAGGTPLYDTGNLFRSLHGITAPTGSGAKLVLRGSQIAALQNKGFSTSGPNWIPFTRAAMKTGSAGKRRRTGRTGTTYPTSNPDGLMVGRGVRVPARPLFAWPTLARQKVARAIARALGAR